MAPPELRCLIRTRSKERIENVRIISVVELGRTPGYECVSTSRKGNGETTYVEGQTHGWGCAAYGPWMLVEVAAPMQWMLSFPDQAAE